MATVFVEILGRRGHVAERVRLQSLPATIGRAYSSDVIVDDRFVSPHHLRLEASREGDMVLIDTSDANGMIDTTSGQRVAELAFDTEALVQIGSTVVRVRSEGFGNEPARPYPGGTTVTPGGWRSRSMNLLILLATFGFSLWREFLGTAASYSVAEYLQEIVGWAVLLFFWVGCWSFASSALAHESFVGRHLRIACAGTLALLLWDTGLAYATFFLSFDSQPSLTAIVGVAIIAALVIFHHLSLVSRQSRRRRQLIAASLASLLVVGNLVSEIASRDDFTWYPDQSSRLKPIPPQLLSVHSPEVLFESATELRERVDALAADPDD